MKRVAFKFFHPTRALVAQRCFSNHVLAKSLPRARSIGTANQIRYYSSKISTSNHTREEFKKFVKLAYPERWLLIIALVALGLNSLGNLFVPYGMGKTFDSIIEIQKDTQGDDTKLEQARQKARYRLYTLGGALFAVFTISGIAMFARVALLNIASARINAVLRKNLYKSLIQQDIAFFDKTRTGELLNRISNDTSVIASTLTDSLSRGIRRSVEGLGGLSVLIYLSPNLTGLMMVVVPIVALGGFYYGRFIKSLSRQVQDSLGKTGEFAEETLSGIRTIQQLTQESHESAKYAEGIDKAFHLQRRAGIYSGSFYGAVGFAGNLALMTVMIKGGLMVIDEQLSFGELTSFLLYSFYVAFAFSGIAGTYGDIMQGVGAAQRVFELTDRTPAILSPSNPLSIESLKGDIEFQNVRFSYPSRSDVTIFQDLNINIPAGKVIALVGSSGSGKSTVISLLARFYDPTSGYVKLDGCDINSLDITWLRSSIGFVSQDPVLFSGTIRENIAYGLDLGPYSSEESFQKLIRSPEVEEQIIFAAKQANAHNFIVNFPEGYDTEIGERGITLSGGQKQRLTIARAIIKNPKILVLDEATSALDAESEYLVQLALENLMKNRTTLVIAHRLSTVKQADSIVVLHQGTIAEQGTHNELMEKQGIYANLVSRQMAA